MKKKIVRYVSLGEFTREALKTAIYEKDTSLGKLPCIVAEVPVMPGCFTQGETIEETRENLVEAIELWVIMAIRQNETLPVINDCALSLPKFPAQSRKLKSAFA